jgi:glucosamine 6-phosphate synthetase-like amidotransferase/phosphosugar isomerase protein
MCGVVCYFGSTGNCLARILTGMSSIIYRAPDSTGVGWFGDDLEPLRVVKSLGSVSSLIQVLQSREAYPDHALQLLGLWISQKTDLSLCEHQESLLKWEGFTPGSCQLISDGETNYPTFENIMDKNISPSIRIVPGMAGRPDSLPSFSLKFINDLREMIRLLIVQYDMSPLAIKALVKTALIKGFTDRTSDELSEVDSDDLIEAFDEVFDRALWEEEITGSNSLKEIVYNKSFHAYEHIWEILSEITISVPSEYDSDGIRSLFRLLDASLLSRIPYNSELGGLLQRELQEIWPEMEKHGSINWWTLYQAEKGVNVYGWAAAAGLAYLQETELLPELGKGELAKNPSANTVTPGLTDPLTLRFLSSPIISHGRWALQSPVSVRNAHPFFDSSKQRIVVLNGQFDGEVEAELHDFLEKIGFSFRSDNSSEYMSLLWGYYFDVLKNEQSRSEIIRSQVDAGLEVYCIGSQNIDYKASLWLKDRTIVKLDELAFIEAARQIIRRGGQIAVSGISIKSPRCLYVASHNRPVFVARRAANDGDVMVVSDINAAMGLFPQSLIFEKSLELKERYSLYLHELERLQASEADKRAIRVCKEEYNKKKNAILETFRINVLPLKGEEVFARIETILRDGDIDRRTELTDFAGNPLPGIEDFEAVLNPLETKKELFKSFYETHLNEIPDRLVDILDAYLPENEVLPELGINKRYLLRRFGPKFIALKRIVLVGMGSSYNVGLMAKSLFLKLIPRIEVVCLKPVEVGNISGSIDSEKDLVILLSWSGSSADMVKFTKALIVRNISMIGITERPFSEMALITRKTGGVISILSGEEITFSAIKSSICQLFCLDLFSVWLASGLGHEEAACEYMDKLGGLPELLQNLLKDQSMEEFSRSLAYNMVANRAVIVIDALFSTGTGREATLKLEENSSSGIGKSLDYRDVVPATFSKELSKNLILVNATNDTRLEEAIDIMEKLYLGDIPFAAVSYNNSYQPQITKYSRGLGLILPKNDDTLQPFVDLIFYYNLVYHSVRERGSGDPGFPRNRAKSVTTASSRSRDSLQPAAQLVSMDKAGQLFEGEDFPDLRRESVWEREALYSWEKNCYKEMRNLAEILADNDPLGLLLKITEWDIDKASDAILDNLSEGGEIIFVCLDRGARAAVSDVATVWSRLSGGLIRVLCGSESLNHVSDDALLLITATRKPLRGAISKLLDSISVSTLWLGPQLPQEEARFFSASCGYFELKEVFQSSRSSLLYTVLHLILINAWKVKLPKKALILEQLLISGSRVIHTILEDAGLIESIREAMHANLAYETGFYIGSPSGAGIEWVDRFDKNGSLIMEDHLYGDSAHGPLATVDPHVGEKYVCVRARKEMAGFYGEEQVAGWESLYLYGESMDSLLNKVVNQLGFRPGEPFFAEGYWYLPVLQPGYDYLQDNLIIMDATSDRYLDQAFDDLSVFCCRYARMLVISQEPFRKSLEKKGLYSYSVGHLLFLPALQSKGESFPIPDMLLPFASSLVAAASAAASNIGKLKGE